MKARLLALDVIGGTGFSEIMCKSSDDLYTALKCDCFDIAVRKIGEKYFDIFCDDIGLFVDDPIPSALDKELKPMLVGNLIFANHDSAGNTTSLSDEDIKMIKDSAVTVVDYDANPIAVWIAIAGVEY